jgi:hypothetical protein
MSTVHEQIEVWFLREATFYYQDQTSPKWPEDYAHVATLTDIDLKDAYRRTNNIDSSWLKADGVEVNDEGCARYSFGGEWKQGDGVRSCSIGDIFRTKSGEKQRVASSGFDRVFAENVWNALGETFRIPAGEKFAFRDNPCFSTKVEDTDSEVWVLKAFDGYTDKNCEVDWLDFCDLVDAKLIRCHRYFSEGKTDTNRYGTHGNLLATEYSFAGRDYAHRLFSQGASS